MLALRADPWMPDHGMGYEASSEEAPGQAETGIETDDWSRPILPGPARPGPVWFVDGVRRVDLRVIADADGVRAPGLFGSAAVGSVLADGRARFGDHLVERAVITGSGVQPDAVEVSVGSSTVRFEPVSEPGGEADDPLMRLQTRMREAEARLASSIASREGALILADGPLKSVSAPDTVVGVIKRMVRRYLPAEHDRLLARLGRGERTPLFGLGDAGAAPDRFAWYARLVAVRAPWHDHAGIVRCEVRAGVGLAAAVEVADRVTALLPAFAGRASDPRAPQNLAPVGALERWLRHRLGHPGILRRALERRLVQESAA